MTQLPVAPTWAGEVTLTMPNHVHVQVADCKTAGTALMLTAVEGGVQGVPVAGIHGAGVKAPPLATVAACTAGLDGLEHRPKVLMFVSGTTSATVAMDCAGEPADMPDGRAVSTDGVVPNEHAIAAPLTTIDVIDTPSVSVATG